MLYSYQTMTGFAWILQNENLIIQSLSNMNKKGAKSVEI